jgi:hypothetical protein
MSLLMLFPAFIGGRPATLLADDSSAIKHSAITARATTEHLGTPNLEIIVLGEDLGSNC